MIEDEYRTIEKPSEGLFKDKGSRFVSFAWPVENEETIKAILQQVKKAHYTCNHHCYAFRLHPPGDVFRCSDDREPSGSAGRPILGQLLSYTLTDTLIVVARYFGGNLLGVPGLINAYRNAAIDAINNATIIVKTVNARIKISIPYELMNELLNVIRSESAEISKQEYGERMTFHISVRKSRKIAFIEKLTNNTKLGPYLSIN